MAKTINTRIALKIDTLSNWNASTFIPLAGEACIAKVDTVAGSTLQPVMIKIGDGVNTFANLDWMSAKAADVYGWAKKAGIEIEDNGTGKFLTDASWDNVNDKIVLIRADVDWSDIQNIPALGTSDQIEGLQDAVDAINKELDTHGDIVTHDASEFATAAQGALADTAIQEADLAPYAKTTDVVTNDEFTTFEGTNTQAIADAKAGAEATAASALATARTEITAEIGTAVAPLATTEALNGVKAIAEQGVSDAAIAKGVADAAKTRIDAFLDGTADAESAIDTLVEIQNYMTSDTEAFTVLSGRVSTAEGDIDTLEGKVADLEAKPFDTYATKTEVENVNKKFANYTNTNDLTTLLAGKEEAGAAADALAEAKSYADQAEADAIAAAKTAGDLAYEPIGAESRAKSYADGEIAAAKGELTEEINKKANDAALAPIAKTGSTDDLIGGTEVWVFNCGNASDKLNTIE